MSTCSDRRGQRGDVMLEALFGVLITSLIGAGLAHVAASAMNSQRDAKVENLVVEHLRGQLQRRGVGLCDGGNIDLPLPGNDKQARVSCEAASANVTVAGVTHAIDAPMRVDLTVAATDLGSKDAAGDDPDLLISTRQ